MTRTQRAVAATGLLMGAAVMLETIARTRRTIDLHGRIALITGGSRGLGLLLARELGRQGTRLVLVARDEAELTRAAHDLQAEGITASILVADLRDEREAQRIIDETVTRFGAIDILINNAGVITVGPIDHMSSADFDESMAVHFRAPLQTMLAAIPHMRRQGGGRIVNVSSIGGRIGVPHLAPYCAGKFALAGLSSSLQAELAKDGIAVTTVYPGLMRTGSSLHAQFKGQHRAEFTWFAIADSLPILSIDGGAAAMQIVEALRRGDPELVISWPAQVAIAASALVPRLLSTFMAIANRLLPSASGDSSRSYPGWQSTSNWAPSRLTKTADRAAVANNEIPPAIAGAT